MLKLDLTSGGLFAVTHRISYGEDAGLNVSEIKEKERHFIRYCHI